MRDRGSTEYETEEEAIQFLTGSNKHGRKETIKALKSLDLDHNRNRSKKEIDWNDISIKMKQIFSTHTKIGNLEVIAKITEQILVDQDYIVAQNPWESMLNLLNNCSKKSVLFMLSKMGGEPPVLPSTAPTAVFDVILEDPVLIDSPSSTLPNTVAKATLYLPGAPEKEDEKMIYLQKLAKEKQIPLSSTITIQDCNVFSKFVDKNENSLICYPTPKVARVFLSSLKTCSHIKVTADPQLEDLITEIFGAKE